MQRMKKKVDLIKIKKFDTEVEGQQRNMNRRIKSKEKFLEKGEKSEKNDCKEEMKR